MIDKSTTKIAISEVDKIEQLLDQTPNHRATVISKRRAIARLAPKLYAMRDKGYSWGAIAAWLTEQGLKVTASLLNGYLRDAPSSEGGASGRRSKGRARKRAGGAESPSSVSKAVETPARTRHEAAAVKGSTKAATTDPLEAGRRRSEFHVRPDSEEI